MFETFRLFKIQAENQFPKKIKIFRFDGGGEFMSKQFQTLLSENGILHQVSCPFTPKQNGRTERRHRHVVETGLTLLFTAHMSFNYWVDAFLSAVYLTNRMPSKSLTSYSPWQKLFKNTPD